MTGFTYPKFKFIHRMRPIILIQGTSSLQIREFAMKIGKINMFSYNDTRIRRYLFQCKISFEHSKSVFSFTVPCIRKLVGHLGMLH